MEHRISAAYHSQTNGLVEERFNQTLDNMLTQLSGEKHDNWDESLMLPYFAYRYVKYLLTFTLNQYI